MQGYRKLLPYPHENVDHIDGNGLDNRRENLRIATQAENQRNRGKQTNNTSGFKGVSWRNKNKKWQAQIKYNSKTYHIGLYDTPEEAYAAYCEKAEELHGDFANLGDE